MNADTTGSGPASGVTETPEVLFGDPNDDLDGDETALTLVVAAPGDRLDKWLAGQLPEHSRSEIQRWVTEGLVTSRGRRLKASYRVLAGDELAVAIPPPEDYAVEPEPIPLEVVYEDADLLVINKPAGMVVHPAAGNWHGTLVNAVLFHCPDLEGVGGAHRPGIVHRLDKDTSGIIVVAKNDAAHRELQAQFQARSVRKSYVALVHGWLTPERGEINAPVGRDPRQWQRMAVVPLAQGRSATTGYEVVAYYQQAPNSTAERYTLVACHPLTGRTHQIRVHLAHIRHPVVADTLYAGRRKSSLTCPRQFLHAERIHLRLPATGEEMEFAVPLPADLQTVLDRLQRAGQGLSGAR